MAIWRRTKVSCRLICLYFCWKRKMQCEREELEDKENATLSLHFWPRQVWGYFKAIKRLNWINRNYTSHSVVWIKTNWVISTIDWPENGLRTRDTFITKFLNLPERTRASVRAKKIKQMFARIIALSLLQMENTLGLQNTWIKLQCDLVIEGRC